MANKYDFEKKISDFLNISREFPNNGIGKYTKVISTLILANVLEGLLTDMDKNPYLILGDAISTQSSYLREISELRPHLDFKKTVSQEQISLEQQSKKLFEAAWTAYGDESYEKSVEIIRQRLEKNGLGCEFFKGKVCFDGGCGTGRFSIAMAELGAKHIVAADFGTESLEYLSKAIKKYNLCNIEIVKQDVTDLTQWADNSFDFVVSNGVLHHAVETERGIKEHFRVTAPNGLFFLYLYGAGGVYWETYDKLKTLMNQISIDDIKAILLEFSIREGLIYTYLDNICAPIRKYYYVSEVLKLLEEEGDFTYSQLMGTFQGDDPQLQAKTKYFKKIYGPEGEVRLIIRKNGS